MISIIIRVIPPKQSPIQLRSDTTGSKDVTTNEQIHIPFAGVSKRVAAIGYLISNTAVFSFLYFLEHTSAVKWTCGHNTVDTNSHKFYFSSLSAITNQELLISDSSAIDAYSGTRSFCLDSVGGVFLYIPTTLVGEIVGSVKYASQYHSPPDVIC